MERTKRESPQPETGYGIVPSRDISYDGEISKARFSGPDRTKFVTETETPGGYCVNCHNNLQRDWSMTRRGYTCQRLEKRVCVCVCKMCVCVKYVCVCKMKIRLHMILYNQFPKQDATESWMAVANQLVKASLWSEGTETWAHVLGTALPDFTVTW